MDNQTKPTFELDGTIKPYNMSNQTPEFYEQPVAFREQTISSNEQLHHTIQWVTKLVPGQTATEAVWSGST